VSVVDLAHLEPLLGEDVSRETDALRVRPGRVPILRAIRKMIEGGVPSVNVCTAKELDRELFTYAGAGMFFTRDRYADVRPLSIDDYDLANDLIERGEADGFLAPRDEAARDTVLAHGVGVFIEGRYLAGIGAILPHQSSNAAELASLFALTRYMGEGAGGQIVRYAIERARAEGLDYLFSCTTSERVESFFERHGFVRVAPEQVPPAKWADYDPARRARVRCLRFDLKA
jgi:N-acetylglutamate synthase-like GNAT family acetyltransferase